jgi:hypothetical protein
MRSISPDLRGSKGFEQLENDDQRVAEEIDRLNRLLKWITQVLSQNT